MESHGGDVELLGIEDGIVRLRLQGSCSSCQASSATLELAVRQALEELAPDLEGMDVEGVEEPEMTGVALPMAAQPANGSTELGSLVSLPLAGEPGGGGTPSWFDVDGVAGLAPEELMAARRARRAARDRERRRARCSPTATRARAAAAVSTAACCRRAR